VADHEEISDNVAVPGLPDALSTARYVSREHRRSGANSQERDAPVKVRHARRAW